MKKLLLAMVLLPFLYQVVDAGFEINPKHRIENFGPGYCAWCSIETLGRHNGVKKLYNLAKNRSKESNVKKWDGEKWVATPYVMVEYSNGQQVQERRNVGTDWGVYRKLKELNVKFRMQWTGDKSDALIKYAIKNKLGCVFAVKDGTFGKGTSAHAMILVDYTDKKVEYIDPNDPESIYEATREWFDHWQTGWIVVIEKEK